MDRKKIIVYTTIGLMSLILVCVMFMQFKTIQETDIEEVQFLRETELKEMLADYKANYQEVQEQIEDMQTKIDEYKASEESKEIAVELLEKEVQEASMKLGVTDVSGEGVIIRMENKERAIGYTDLLALINELTLSGAEAISINDKRISGTTWIKTVNNFVVIDDERATSPFIIKAIGDKKQLYSARTIKGGYIDTFDELYSITIEESSNVTIGRYNKQLTLNYAK